MGRRPKLPLKSPHWVHVAMAWGLLLQHFGPGSDLTGYLDRLLAGGRLRLKVRANGKERVLTRADFAGAQPVARWHGIIRCKSLTGDAEVFAWKPDLLNIFAADEFTSATEPKQPEKPTKMGRPPKYDYLDLGMEALHLIRDNPKINEADFIDKLAQRLDRQGKEVPGESELQRIFKQARAFEKTHPKVRR